jgi:hypothetical protein
MRVPGATVSSVRPLAPRSRPLGAGFPIPPGPADVRQECRIKTGSRPAPLAKAHRSRFSVGAVGRPLQDPPRSDILSVNDRPQSALELSDSPFIIVPSLPLSLRALTGPWSGRRGEDLFRKPTWSTNYQRHLHTKDEKQPSISVHEPGPSASENRFIRTLIDISGSWQIEFASAPSWRRREPSPDDPPTDLA